MNSEFKVKKIKKNTVNCQLSTVNCSRGFTLLEAMVAIAIIGVIGFILSDLLSKTFKGSDKTKLISKIVQNGQVALNNLDQSIRNSDSVICIGNLSNNTQSNSTIVIVSKGQFSRFSFLPSGSSSNGYIYQDNLTVAKLPQNLQDFCQNSQVTDVFTILSTAKLTDPSPTSGISISNGIFTKISQAGFKDAVTTQFQAGQSVSASTGFQNQLGGTGVIDFKTTTTLR